ncbi:PREDICTED: E3 ubiquitin-protein ligase Siah1-like [Condylura cristata]|uniref:E3 ubiquitin-protein ligase Siah1-like n=1 Tax=Condylura cristata TaxID=143302 RepID=UPI000334788E|nr:PREDICTED: E3 ubiquitin-protein ligase Siah1-like [Condylura cristata]
MFGSGQSGASSRRAANEERARRQPVRGAPAEGSIAEPALHRRRATVGAKLEGERHRLAPLGGFSLPDLRISLHFSESAEPSTVAGAEGQGRRGSGRRRPRSEYESESGSASGSGSEEPSPPPPPPPPTPPSTAASTSSSTPPARPTSPPRSSTASPPRRMSTLSSTMASNSDLASIFECPVCFDYALPPILQCQSGHLVCHDCRPKLTRCPTCRGPLGTIRNLAMEKVANSVLFPCKYNPFGCEYVLPHQERAEHEETCDYRRYPCPCPGSACRWQGRMDTIVAHLVQQHKCITTLQGEDIVFLATDITLPGAIDWVMMQSCFDSHFMLVLEKQEKCHGQQQFFAIVLLIGNRKQAENFIYRLELNASQRRLTWEAKPKSIHEGIETAIRKNDCLVFDSSTAQLFAENGNLGISVTIFRC